MHFTVRRAILVGRVYLRSYGTTFAFLHTFGPWPYVYLHLSLKFLFRIPFAPPIFRRKAPDRLPPQGPTPRIHPQHLGVGSGGGELFLGTKIPFLNTVGGSVRLVASLSCSCEGLTTVSET